MQPASLTLLTRSRTLGGQRKTPPRSDEHNARTDEQRLHRCARNQGRRRAARQQSFQSGHCFRSSFRSRWKGSSGKKQKTGLRPFGAWRPSLRALGLASQSYVFGPRLCRFAPSRSSPRASTSSSPSTAMRQPHPHTRGTGSVEQASTCFPHHEVLS